MSGGEGFLDRWARRKRAAPEERAAEEVEANPPPEATPEPDERTDEEILAELGLPDPDSLSDGDDIKGFMAAAVPEHLRRRALRRLWRFDPVLANVDGLVDYGEDFTDAATVIANLQTAYRVGHGMRPEEVVEPAGEEKAVETAEDEDEDADADGQGEAEDLGDETPEQAPDPAADGSTPEMLAEADPAPEAPIAPASPPEPVPEARIQRRARMRFQLPEA